MPRVIQTSTRLHDGYDVLPITVALSVISVAGATFTMVPSRPGHIVGIDFITTQAGVGGNIVVSPTVDGVSVVGADLNLTAANTANVGDELFGTNATGLQRFTATQTVGLSVAVTAAFTAGWGIFKLKLEYLTNPIGDSPT